MRDCVSEDRDDGVGESDTAEFKDGYLFDIMNDELAPLKMKIEDTSRPLDLIKSKKKVTKSSTMSSAMKRKAFSGPGGLRQSLDGEYLDRRSLSVEKDFSFLNLRELDLVFAFASPLVFTNPKTFKKDKLQILNHREEFRRIGKFTLLFRKVKYPKLSLLFPESLRNFRIFLRKIADSLKIFLSHYYIDNILIVSGETHKS